MGGLVFRVISFMVLYASGESWFQDRNLKAVNCMTMSEIILAIVFLETTIWTTARKGCNQSMLPSGGSFNFRTTITPPKKKAASTGRSGNCLREDSRFAGSLLPPTNSTQNGLSRRTRVKTEFTQSFFVADKRVAPNSCE